MITQGAKLGKSEECIRMALSTIVQADRSPTLDLLLQHNLLTINTLLSDEGWLPLHIAAREKGLECCMLLVNQYKAPITVTKPSMMM